MTPEELAQELIRIRTELHTLKMQVSGLNAIQLLQKRVEEEHMSERKRVIEEVREWAKDYCWNNGDYSAVGAINEMLEYLTKLEAGAE